MRRTFLIARQEFIKYVTRRGFWISIFMFPLWIAIVILVPQWTSKSGGGESQGRILVVADQSGGAYRDAIAQALKRSHRPHLALADPPADLAHATQRDFALAAKPYLDGDEPLSVGPRGSRALSAALFIPRDFDAHASALLVSRDAADNTLRDFLTDVLSTALQRAALTRLAPAIAASPALNATATLQVRSPPEPSRPRDSAYESIVPMALAIILFIVSVMNASVLLQGVVEEKSTRMIEVLLSCATPREITSGKLIGVIAVALVTLLLWGLALFVLMTIASAGTTTLVFHALAAVGPATAPFLLLYFLCGLLIYGSIFLAIGSMANSLADAQSLLGPTMLILILPNLMISGIMQDPNGTLASTISWVPFYTPFFMMLRIASHPPAWQLWGTAALALATASFLVWWTGRVFARHVLTTERPPALGALIGRLLGRRA